MSDIQVLETDDEITAQNYANLINSTGLTRDEVADEDGSAKDVLHVVILTAPMIIQVNEDKWAIFCPDHKYAEFLADDQNWLDIVNLLTPTPEADTLDETTEEE